ncbi:bifunctional methylenetetrahydrofolate dehydrogenase/cyclohydrolase 2, mitochondrial isoform X4 [Castor canadensis]|uniref:Bifunctional methylenetetrahydrofolate dehydrogenase/cyclohydrolase 2, mitochondrial isoform X4 n=2 Tax=Castor canadensis TaxID=51338 RepID=A0AC58JZK5_CASCN
MAVRARGLSLLGGSLGPALSPGAAGRALRGFRSSGARHEAIIISGTEMAKQIQKELQQDVESWIALGNRRPHLSIILVGDNPASHTYVKNKIRAASAVGICSELILKPKDISQEELLDVTDQLNMDPRVSGILVQLPLPDHVDERTVCNGIAPEKDVDGFHIINIGRLCLDQHSLIPATASAVWEIIKRTGIETFGKNVVVAGRSKNVGMPIAMLLHTDGQHERPGAKVNEFWRLWRTCPQLHKGSEDGEHLPLRIGIVEDFLKNLAFEPWCSLQQVQEGHFSC